MKTKTKIILSTIFIPICLVFVFIHERQHFAERAIDPQFLGQIHVAFATNAIWPSEPKEVASRLVAADLFPIGRPHQDIGDASAIISSQSSDRCTVNVLEGFFETNTMLLATDDKIVLQREGSIWIPIHREVSWQTKKRPGLINDPF